MLFVSSVYSDSLSRSDGKESAFTSNISKINSAAPRVFLKLRSNVFPSVTKYFLHSEPWSEHIKSIIA